MAWDRSILHRLRTALGPLDLAATRSLLRNRRRHAMVLGISLAYLLIAMNVGEMLDFLTTPVTYAVYFAPSSLSPVNWVYPLVEVSLPGVIVVLPILPTLTMLFMSLGVGISLTTAVLLALGWIRERRAHVVRSTGTASFLMGWVPAAFGMATLGACCSAAITGTIEYGFLTRGGAASGNPLFVNIWYLSAFQVALVGAALIAQEELFRLYLRLLDRPGNVGARSSNSTSSEA